MLRLVDKNNFDDHNRQQDNMMQRKLVGDLTKQQIHMRDKEMGEMRRNEKMADQQMIEMDNVRAREMNDKQKMMKE